MMMMMLLFHDLASIGPGLLIDRSHGWPRGVNTGRGDRIEYGYDVGHIYGWDLNTYRLVINSIP